ncbi:hypothetical protein SAMN04489761_4285 [Tenacibaculum sp. MAR_2009_124]|uniref:hypothetical protein n=1 Tax=Tenacibaculum sp. MAR_2009_124 TaxID=1250059 RepID=UPI00089AE9C2|nr:hypothetical protein [Tenacibaculum sp. MAR_2009_124]SED10393.1 hypothetical protein SAMN04489761_4285 [Tenacibaculum sp. MAR_2009_124]
MPRISNNFVQSRLNKNVDERLLKKGELRDSLNVRIINSEGSDAGAIEKSLSNKQLTNLNLGDNMHTIGGVSDEFNETLYWFVKSSLGSFIIEYNILTQTTQFVLKDTRNHNVLNFNEEYLINSSRILIDTDNNSKYLLITDNYNQPLLINIERAKTYDENGFDLDDIILIKRPPINSPEINLRSNGSKENNLEEKFLRFSYRYIYLDGEYSALSPYSEIGFKPKSFEFDYYTSTNKSMINSFNEVEIEFNSGSKNVKAIEVVFIECGKNIPYVIDNFNKKNKGWLDDTDYKISFSNNKIVRNLPEEELYRLFDAVPLRAKALELINNTLVFANYTENYNLVNDNGEEIYIDLELNQENVPVSDASESCKTNRDYEVAIAYLDSYGRQTTPLVSENNTTYIEHSNSTDKNSLVLKIKNKAPYFAKYYRVYIKQNKIGYHTIVPNIFYEDNGYVWVKLEGNQKDAIIEGQYLNVKSDTRKILDDIVKVKVLEVVSQDKNFLDTSGSNEFKQLSGLYMKIKPERFSLDLEDLARYYFNGFEWSTRSYHPVKNNVNVLQPAIFYGNSSLNDATVIGNYSGDRDKSFYVQITSEGDGVTTKDKFIVEYDNTTVVPEQDIQVNVEIPMIDGLSVKFQNDTGHTYGDQWIVRGKSYHTVNHDWSGKGMAVYKGIEGDTIETGAIIDIIYDEYNNKNQYIHFHFISTKKYSNLEEWFYGDDIDAKFAEKGIDSIRVSFRRGNVGWHGIKDPEVYVDISSDGVSGTMNLLIASLGFEKNGGEDSVRIKFSIEIKQFNNRVIFETDPVEENSDIFYEIGRTYKIEQDLHFGFDNSDTSQTINLPAVLKLPFYNCFTWGNGFESYKIKDQFNAKELSIKTRPSAPIEDYRENIKVSGLTYSKPYDQSLNYNGLNEFNLSTLNFKDLDDKYGGIQIIMAYNTDLDVWQEDKVHKVFYGKSLIYSEDGSSNLAKSDNILGAVKAYAGEFGISNNPESLVSYGNYRYWVDSKRGIVLRKGQSGIEIISNRGMTDWFRDYFKTNRNSINLCGYDPYYGQLTLCLKNHTLTFDEKIKGFTSFHSFLPDWVLRMNNSFYTFKNGQLWEQNSSGNGYNNFYGVQYESKVTTILNDFSNADSIFKTMVLDASNSWNVKVKSNLSKGHLKASDFNKIESRWYAHFFKNEDLQNLHGNTQGLGSPIEVYNNKLSFHAVPSSVSIGDDLCLIDDNENIIVLGQVLDVDSNIVSVDFYESIDLNKFYFTKKNSRIEGGEIRGYYMEIELYDSSNEANELFAISSEVVPSFIK